jgi:uncharacterized lipoprotein
MRLTIRIVLLALCAVALGACHSSGYLQKHGKAAQCVEHPIYLAAQSAPPLRTPEGLVAPNTKNALKIAEATGTATPRTTKDGCLDKPPSFFAEQAKPSAAGAKHPDPPAQ